MIPIDLQMFGGNGSGSELSMGGGENVNIVNETDVWTYRHNKNNAPFVDAINTSVKAVQDDFTDVMETVYHVNAAELSGSDKTHTLGYYGGGDLAINLNFTDIDKMNAVYDKAVESGYHPARGNYSGTEAVTFHEMGHALTDYLAKKLGVNGLDQASKRIVEAAYRATNGKGGTKKWAGGISGYAQDSYAECVAEATADYYCNGANASSQSKAIMAEMRKIAKIK